jgi:hypothetical protein
MRGGRGVITGYVAEGLHRTTCPDPPGQIVGGLLESCANQQLRMRRCVNG